MADSNYNVIGNPAIVHSPALAPIENMKIYFQPIQEGTGTPSPENIRAINGWTSINAYQSSTNLLPFEDVITEGWTNTADGVTMTYSHGVISAIGTHTVSGWTNVASFDRCWSSNPIILPPGKYINSGSVTSYFNFCICCRIDGAGITNKATTFTAYQGVEVVGFYLAVKGEQDFNYECPLVLTPGTIRQTSYTPYKSINTFPIEMKTIGKNLIHTKYPSRTATGITFTVNSDYTVTVNGTATGQAWLTPSLVGKKEYATFFKAGTYFFSGGKTAKKAAYLAGWYVDGTPFSQSWDEGTGRVYNFKKDVWIYPQICIDKGETVNNETFNIQLEYGTSATEFEPYSETQQTIYGGYIDPAAGKIIAEYVKIAPTKEQFTQQASAGIGYRQTSPIYSPTASGVIWNTARQQQLCNKAPIANPYSESADTYGNYMAVVYTMEVSTTVAYARISEALYQSLDEGETVEFTYKLANPIEYDIPKEKLNTLLGTSIYWSEALQNVEINYEVIDNMEMIEARKRTMQPQLLSKEGDIVEFNTKLQLPLKENTIAWQSEWWKSGTPSLSNVRIIIGNEQLEIKQYKSKNIGDLLAFSGSVNELKTNNLTNSCYSLSNNYTTISNIVGSSVTTTVLQYDTELNKNQYQNGYFGVRFKNLEFNKYYIVSFDVTNITSNPLDASLSDLLLMSPRGWSSTNPTVNGNRVSFRYYHKMYESYPTRNMIEIHICGMNATFSNFMVTREDEPDQTYEPYIPTIGKNLGECIASNKTQMGGNFNVRANGTVECSGIPTDYCYSPLMTIPVSASMGTVTFSGLEDTTNLVWEAPLLYDASKNKIATLSSLGSKKTSGSIDLSQYPDVAILYLCVKRQNNNTPILGIIKPQVELGSIVTEFEPYNNNCYKAWDLPNMTTNYFKIKATEMISDGWYRYFPNPLKGAPIGDYWIGCQSVFGGNDQQGARVTIVDKAKNVECTIIGKPLTGWNFGETVPEGYIFPPRVKFTLTQEQSEADYIRFECNSSGTTIDTFLNAHIYITNNYYSKYEPWSNTLYGGELDLNTGILKITHDSIYLYASGKQYNYFYTTTTDMGKGAIESLNADMYCNRLPVTSNVTDTQTDSGVAFYANGIIRFLDADYSSLTPDEYNVQVKDNRPFITYKLKNPIYYQLDSQVLKAFKGNNILTSNTDTIKVKYWVH